MPAVRTQVDTTEARTAEDMPELQQPLLGQGQVEGSQEVTQERSYGVEVRLPCGGNQVTTEERGSRIGAQLLSQGTSSFLAGAFLFANAWTTDYEKLGLDPERIQGLSGALAVVLVCLGFLVVLAVPLTGTWYGRRVAKDESMLSPAVQMVGLVQVVQFAGSAAGKDSLAFWAAVAFLVFATAVSLLLGVRERVYKSGAVLAQTSIAFIVLGFLWLWVGGLEWQAHIYGVTGAVLAMLADTTYGRQGKRMELEGH